MFRIKRLYTFVLTTFLPLILATFSVCLFVLLMQFIWQYIDAMVGKGVNLSVLGEMLFYAMLQLTPMALPLSILLASLMTFGNLGEHLELLSMKASGISLIRIMKPLIVFVVFVTALSFVFQNNILPQAQTKLYTILWSLRQKSPELDIPKSSFYNGISGYSLFVRDKEKDGLMKDVMIYDYSKGAANANVILADSGRLRVSDAGDYAVFTLFYGEWFRNVKDVKPGSGQEQSPYMRETFSLKEILIEHDSNFNMADESIFANRDISKNLKELKHYADSVKYESDSLTATIAPALKTRIYENTFAEKQEEKLETIEVDTTSIHDFQLLYDNASTEEKIRYLGSAKTRTEMALGDYLAQSRQQAEMKRQVRSHQTEFYKKFSLSIACFFFFFIGAPLGAIIRKGGLGMPTVLSVVVFLLYFSLDTFGVKMAKTGVWPVFSGVFLSTFMLILLGVFFTYKAVNDSVIMNPDAWKDALQRLLGKKEVRNYRRKEVIMELPDYTGELEKMSEWDAAARKYMEKTKRYPLYISFWKTDFRDAELCGLIEGMETWIEDFQNSDESLIIGKLMDYPVIRPLRMEILNKTWPKWFCALCLPVGLIIYFAGLYSIKQMRQDLNTALTVNNELRTELGRLKKINL